MFIFKINKVLKKTKTRETNQGKSEPKNIIDKFSNKSYFNIDAGRKAWYGLISQINPKKTIISEIHQKIKKKSLAELY